MELSIVAAVLIVVSFSLALALRRARRHVARLLHLGRQTPTVLCSFRTAEDGTPAFPYVSPRLHDLLGIEPEVAMREPGAIFRQIHPEDVVLVYEAIERSAATRSPGGLTYRANKIDGTPIWIESCFMPEPKRAKDGSLTWHGYLTDVTARCSAEAALRSSRERFERVFAANPACMALRRVSDDRLVEINDAMCRICGYQAAEILGTTRAEWDPIENRDEIARAVAATGRVSDFVVVLRDREGVQCSLSCSIERFDIDGEPHMLTIGLDVTQRQAADTALRESEGRFRQLAGAIDEVFWMTDVAKSRMIYISPGYERIWGRTCESLIASPMSWIEAIHPDDRGRVLSAAGHQDDGRYDETYRIRRPDGTVRWIRDRGFPVRDDAGAIVRIAGVAADVTDTRELEAELRQTQKLESIGLLAGGVAHDFNNLLTVISTCADELGWSIGPDEPQRELVDEIRDSVARGAALTRQLLAFSRRQMIEPRRLHLDTILGETDKMLRRLLGEDVVLTTVLRPGLSAVFADAGQLTQVLVNLAVNARDAMPRGGSLRIETSELDGQVMLSVSDTGCGMRDDVRARVFEPFFTTKAAGRGTGLGLSVTHGIVTQAGGRIEVESELGAGTRITIYLPAVPGTAADDPPRPPVSTLGGSETVMVVEDQETLRKAIGRILRGRGYRVLEAADGRQALAMLTEIGGAVDLIVTDVVMPEMDGRELAEAAWRRWHDLQFLFTSGYTGDEIVRRGVLQTEIELLQKPFESTALLARVRERIDQSSAAAASAR